VPKTTLRVQVSNGIKNSDPYAGGQDIEDGRKTMWTPQQTEEVNDLGDPAMRSLL
jgi:hypothetical protein